MLLLLAAVVPAATYHFNYKVAVLSRQSAQGLRVTTPDFEPLGSTLRTRPVQALNLPPPPEKEEDSLYDTPDFELDATTVLALLGGAIAFNFFVLANL